MNSRPQFFISHSSADKQRAHTIASDLRNIGVGVWIDSERIKYGQSIPEAIEKGLAESDCILVLVSQAFVNSKWCRAEYEPLLMREIDSGVILVVPLLLEDCEVPPLLRRKRYCDLRLEEWDFESRRARLGEVAEQIKAQPRHRADPHTALPTLQQKGSPTQRLRDLVNTADVDLLLEKSGTRSDRQAALELLEAVTSLIEQSEAQYDELAAVLTESGYEYSLYGSANRTSRTRLMRANRKLINTSNEMRAIYWRICTQFALSPDLEESFNSVTECCRQIAVAEDFLVIEGVKNSGDVQFDTQRQEELLDPFRSGDIVESGNWGSGDGGASLVTDYHRILIELNDYKIHLQEAMHDLRRRR